MEKRKGSIQKVKVEKRIPYHEAKKLVNMYNVPKPNLPSYSTVVKKSSMKDMSTQVCEKDFFLQTSVSSTVPISSKDKNESPASTVPSTEAVGVGTTSPVPETVRAPKSSGRRDTTPRKNKQNSDRLPKGAKSPVAMHNKYGVLEEMDFTPSLSSSRVRSLSPKRNKGRISPISHKKS